MSNNIKDRIIEFFDYLSKPQRVIASELGYMGNSSISNYLSGKKPIPKKLISKMAYAYPELNINWIKTGVGSMLNDPWSVNDISIDYVRMPKVINNNILDKNDKTIPILDTDVYASIAPSLSDAVTLQPSTFIKIPMFSQGDFAIQVTGNSMKGYINHGDWVVIKKLTNFNSIIPGEAHLVVTKSDNIKTIKFIRDSEDTTKIKLVPYNTAQFEPHYIEKLDILDIYRIIGLIRLV